MTQKNEKRIVQQTENFIQYFFAHEPSGHDWWHIYRVRNLALKIATAEGGNLFRIEMAALLHDLQDWKLEAEQKHPEIGAFLKEQGVSGAEASAIQEIIEQVSFKGAGVATVPTTTAAKIVQDADRLDAMGAIGIARAFAYGGNRNRLIYHPEIQPEHHISFKAYQKATGPTINHFYEKLLLLKDRLNTKTAKKLAEKRHLFMKEYLIRFFEEWENKS